MGPRMKQLMIYGAAGVGLLGGGWTLLAQMQGGGAQLQGGGGFMQGGAMQGVPPAGNAVADRDSSQESATATGVATTGNASGGNGSTTITPAPSAFAIPGEGPLSVSEIHAGDGTIKPYSPTATPASTSTDMTQAGGLMEIADPAALGVFLTQQPSINAQLTNSSAILVQDSTGAAYSVAAGQLQSLLRLMASPDSGYSGTIDLSQLSPNTAQRLLESGALSPVPQQPGADASKGSAAEAAAAQQGNQSGSPGGGLLQQPQSDGSIQD